MINSSSDTFKTIKPKIISFLQKEKKMQQHIENFRIKSSEYESLLQRQRHQTYKFVKNLAEKYKCQSNIFCLFDNVFKIYLINKLAEL
jgi:hypothetical protein